MALWSMAEELPRIISPRLVIRLMKPSEAPLMAKFRRENKRHLEQWEPLRPPEFFTEGFWVGELRQSLREYRAGASANFALLSASEDEVIGVCNYTGMARGTSQSCNLGYAIAERHQGTGLMFEALERTNQYVFENMRMGRIVAGYLPRNARSGALLSRLGFEREGYARNYLKINGKWEDHILTALTDRGPMLRSV